MLQRSTPHRGVNAIPWVGQFLALADDIAGEAALALAATHSVEAFLVLRDRLDNARDTWFRSVLLSAIALTRQDEATEFLLELVKSESLSAEGAIEAIVRAAPSDEVLERLKKLTSGNPRLSKVVAEMSEH